jgi:hypothetical protein
MVMEWWSAKEVCDHLGITLNNLNQISFRMRKGHELLFHTGKCECLIPDHYGNGMKWYDARKVRAYGLYRKGAPSTVSQVLSIARKKAKLAKAGKIKKGRPTTKVK